MGLCKCPKRKVTTLFCYEHRVNVCQHCMVTNHPKCIVQSYKHWLQDIEYNPVCLLCNKGLATDDCVRLLCYHVFHWTCLDHYAKQLPSTTAPAGFSCPTCKEPFFPKPNVVSPVADVLREKMAGVNWARIGLGLPLLSDEVESRPHNDGNIQSELFPNDISKSQNHLKSEINSDTVVHMEESSNKFNRLDFPVQVPRRGIQSVDGTKTPLLDDDDNKYRRRSPSDWFHRWFKFFPNRLRLPRGPRRSCFLFLITIIIMGFIITIFSTLGRIATADDPSLNLDKHPHVRVNDASK